MDLSILPYLALFLGVASLDLGLFDSTTEEESAETAPTTSPLYDAADYDRVEEGTDGADSVTEPDTNDAIAWFPEAGDDSITSSAGDDYVEGGAGNDTLIMREGDDIIQGGDGNDSIDAGIGFDTVYGDAGNDVISGNGGNDTIFGGAGDDTVQGGSTTDLLFGNDGNDYLSGLGFDLSTSDGATLIDGADTLNGGAGNDTLLGGPGDSLTGGTGDDLFTLDQREGDFGLLTRVTDYSAGDIIEIVYTRTLDGTGAEVPVTANVRASPDGLAGIVSLNGTDIAVVSGGRALTIGDLRLRGV